MRCLSSVLTPFRNEFNNFSNTGARMLDSIHNRTLKLHKNCIFGVKTTRFLFHLFTQRYNGRHYVTLLSL